LRTPSCDPHRAIPTGRALRDGGRPTDAIEPLERSLALRPGHPPTLQSLAIALRTSGRVQEAVDLLRGLVAAHPDLAAAHYVLGHCLHE
jgi:predicted Zn-dependent protease